MSPLRWKSFESAVGRDGSPLSLQLLSLQLKEMVDRSAVRRVERNGSPLSLQLKEMVDRSAVGRDGSQVCSW